MVSEYPKWEKLTLSEITEAACTDMWCDHTVYTLVLEEVLLLLVALGEELQAAVDHAQTEYNNAAVLFQVLVAWRLVWREAVCVMGAEEGLAAVIVVGKVSF